LGLAFCIELGLAFCIEFGLAFCIEFSLEFCIELGLFRLPIGLGGGPGGVTLGRTGVGGFAPPLTLLGTLSLAKTLPIYLDLRFV
jgi:hypothetical protein